MHAGGATVTIADVNDDRSKALVDELGDRASFAHADVTSEDEVKAAVDQAAQADGGL
ncbi:MAG: SDR family oxidoreductase, partial [Solirubrobacterales bacterium]